MDMDQLPSGEPPQVITRILSILLKFFGIIINAVFFSFNRMLRLFLKIFEIMGAGIKKIIHQIPKLIAPFVPKRTQNNVNQRLIYAGVEMTSLDVLSITLVYSIVVTSVTYLMATLFGASQLIIILAVTITFFSVWALPFVILNILSMNRSSTVELMLPEMLTMISQNMAAGMTSYNALWTSARPEFGPLADEIKEVAKSTLTGIPLTDALMGMTNHIESVKLMRVIRLMIQGMKSGGDLPTVLSDLADDMRNEENLKRQMAAETSAQAIFILFAIVVGAPLLFAVSTQFLTIFSGMMDKLDIVELSKASKQQSLISLHEIPITGDEFGFYAIVSLALSSLFASFLLGILKNGNPAGGVSYILPLILSSIGVFFAIKMVLKTVFAGMVAF